MSDSLGDPEAPYVRNDVSGTVNGPIVQAQHIHGGISYNVHFHSSSDRETKPDQLPSMTVRFINRSADLAVFDGWFADASTDRAASVGMGAVYGLPGVGKTAMICRWAQRSRGLFPDGQIYVDFAALRHLAGSDVSAAAAMCLRALGVRNEYIPESLAEQSALFRSRSADRRVLVFLDNVNQPAQVRPLVPKGPGSILLFTSHGKLGELLLDGARLMSLEPLDTDSGLRVLADRCGEQAVAAERPAAERLVELCGGLPVALHVVAARLLASPRLTMTALADELADEAGRLAGMSLRGEHSVSAVLGVAYRELPPDAARLYRLLGWFPGRTFDAGTAAIAADIDTATAVSLLDVLETTRLLDLTKDGRFRFHDLVRLHARERAADEEPESGQRALTERVATHYLALTAFADRAIREDRLRIADLADFLRGAPNPFAAENGPLPLDWLEAERANILAVLRATTRHDLYTHTWQLSEAFTVLFLHHRHLLDWRESLDIGAAAATKAMVPAAEARLRSLLSRPLMDLGEYDKAHAELNAALACAEVSAHTVLSASVQEFSGRYWDHFKPSLAMAAYQRSFDLNVEAQEWRGAAIASYFLGCAQDAGGQHEKALKTLRRAYQDLTARDDQRMAARAMAALGVAHGHLGHTEEAMRVLSEAARTLRAQTATHYEAQALVGLADIVERTGGDRSALRAHLTRAHEIYATGGSPEAEKLRARLGRLDDE